MQQNIDIDNQLRQFALEAQKHPVGADARKLALHHLLSTIAYSGLLSRPRIPHHLHGLYPEIYSESKQRLFSYMCEKIDNYNPEHGGVLQWANFLLRKRFVPEAIRELAKYRKTSIMSLDDLAYQEAPMTDDGRILRDLIEQDPDGLFHTTCIAKNPTVTFQFIALRVLAGYSWKEISTELDIPVPTLNSFYQRNLKKLKTYLQKYLQSKQDENISAASFNN